MVVYLGGTTEANWREMLMPILKSNGIEYYNPVFNTWEENSLEGRDKIKNDPETIELYVLTNDMQGFYQLAEAVQASSRKWDKVILYVIPDGFTYKQVKSFDDIKVLLKSNGTVICESFNEILRILISLKGI